MTFTDALMQAKRYANTGSEGPVGVRTASTASNRFSERPLRPMSKTPQPFNPTPAGAGTSPLSGYLGNDVITSELPQPFNPTPTPAGGAVPSVNTDRFRITGQEELDYLNSLVSWYKPTNEEEQTVLNNAIARRDEMNKQMANQGAKYAQQIAELTTLKERA